MNNIPVVTRNLLYVNIIMFIASAINPAFMEKTFAMAFPLARDFRWWQPLSHMFMHGGFWHIFFNMYSLVMFGSVVERALGTKKYLIFYFVTGFGAVLLHFGVQWLQILGTLAANPGHELEIYNHLPRVMGASGAIYGILVGFAMLYPEARLTLIFPPITLDAKWWVGIFVGIELFTGVVGTRMGIAHFAHLGGALFGFLLIRFWKKNGALYR